MAKGKINFAPKARASIHQLPAYSTSPCLPSKVVLVYTICVPPPWLVRQANSH